MTKDEIYDAIDALKSRVKNSMEQELNAGMAVIAGMITALPDATPIDSPVTPPSEIARDIQPMDGYQHAYVKRASNARYKVILLRKVVQNHNIEVLFLKVVNRDGSPKNGTVLHVGAPGWDGQDTQSGWKDPGTVEFPITTNGHYQVAVKGDAQGDAIVLASSEIVMDLDNTIDSWPGDDQSSQRHHSWEITFMDTQS